MSAHQIQELIFDILRCFVFIGFPCIICVVAIVFLIKIFKSNSPSLERKKTECIDTLITKTKSKRENVARPGITFYYVSFDELSEFRVAKEIYEKTNAGDTVEIVYEGTRLLELTVIDKTDEMTIPNKTITGYFDK